MSFADRVIEFHHSLEPNWELPPGVEILFPYDQELTMQALTAFYQKYYDDARPRVGLFGINPGRFGAGVTGVPFTDPIRLEIELGIANDFDKKPELSSLFIYELIRAWGGVEAFYQKFYITSLSPLGFTRNGRNYNYYDDRRMQDAVEPHIIEHLRTQLEMGLTDQVALCLGRGKNMTYFEKVNEKHEFFQELLPLPHPRWVMQYRRRRMQEYIDLYLEKLHKAVETAGI